MPSRSCPYFSAYSALAVRYTDMALCTLRSRLSTGSHATRGDSSLLPTRGDTRGSSLCPSPCTPRRLSLISTDRRNKSRAFHILHLGKQKVYFRTARRPRTPILSFDSPRYSFGNRITSWRGDIPGADRITKNSCAMLRVAIGIPEFTGIGGRKKLLVDTPPWPL